MQILTYFMQFLGKILLILILLLPGLPCSAQGMATEPNQVEAPISHSQELNDPKELETFLDQFFTERMPRLHIPGAAFVLVKDGKIFFSKGYGYSDLEKKTPVVPDKTLFSVGSVSKVFTATAVMQLVERGKLSLTKDVNQYLKRFQLQENYPAPVTLANLLTHTGGFDDRFIGTGARSATEVKPLGEYLAKRMPPRVMPPGEVTSYSNYGMVLAGYLVEVASGVPFAQYVNENILQPLGMEHSSFSQPLPANLVSDQAVGYKYHLSNYQPTRFYIRGIANPPQPDSAYPGTYQRLPFYYTSDLPSGGLKTTATDMARFMIPHLQNGHYGNVQIMQEATAREMHAAHFANHPQLPGWTYGFSERFQNNQRAIEKGGEKPGFASLLFLLPDRELGFFVAYNNSHKELREELVNQFLDHYYPVEATFHLSTINQQRAHYFTGNYRYNRYPRLTLEKLGPLLLGFPEPAPELRVIAKGNGTLFLGTNQLVEVEPLLFQSTDGFYVAFRENDQGRITHMFIGTEAFERLPWYETTVFQISLLGFCILIFLSPALIWSLYSRIRGSQKRLFQTSRSVRWMQLITGLTGAVNLFFLISLVLVLLLSNLYEFAYRVPPIMVALLFIPLLTTVLTVGLLIFTVLLCKNKYWSALERLHHSLMMLALLSFTGFLNYWNLLGFRF